MTLKEVKRKFPPKSIICVEYRLGRGNFGYWIGVVKNSNLYQNGDSILIPIVYGTNFVGSLHVDTCYVYIPTERDIIRFANGKERHELFDVINKHNKKANKFL